MQPQSFSVTQGETLEIPITISDANGEPLDLTQTTAIFGMARRAGDALVVDSEDVPPTATATVRSAEDGIIDVVVPGNIIGTLLGTYEWECRARDLVNDEVVVARGYITVARRVLGIPASS